MYEHQDAIDINDFVHAATGARVRRLTLPDGTHWFPAADVARELGYANTRQAIQWHVPPQCNSSLQQLVQGVCVRDGLGKLTGHGLQKHMKMVDLEGLIRLVNGCTKPAAEPFKNWVTEVVVAVQRDGSYSLAEAEVQPADAGAAVAYAVPQKVADAIVRLEEHNLRLDEEWLAQRRADRRFQEEVLAQQREMVGLLSRLVENTEPARGQRESGAQPSPGAGPQLPPSAGAVSLLSLWERNQLAITKDVWPVAALMAGWLTSHGEAKVRMEDVADRTGLPQEKVLAALRLLLRHNCVRQCGVDADGAHVYVLPGA